MHPKCPGCKALFITEDERRDHQRREDHCYCAQCVLCFGSPQGIVAHFDFKRHVSQYKCLDCNRSFRTQHDLSAHLNDAIVHQKERGTFTLIMPKSEDPELYCKDCERQFEIVGGLRQHCVSWRHTAPQTALRCPLSEDCPRLFQSPSALVAHLTGGGCKSGIDRLRLNELVARVDYEHAITHKDTVSLQSGALKQIEDAMAAVSVSSSFPAIAPAALPPITGACRLTQTLTSDMARSLASLPMSAAFCKSQILIGGNESDNDDDDDQGGVMLSPDLSISRSPPTAAVPPIFSSSNDAHAALVATSIICPLCPGQRTFYSEHRLQRHLTSAAHAPRIYHCSTAIHEMLGLNLGRCDKHFRDLSGLVAHLQSKACNGGAESLQRAVTFVKTQMRRLEIGGQLKLLLEE